MPPSGNTRWSASVENPRQGWSGWRRNASRSILRDRFRSATSCQMFSFARDSEEGAYSCSPDTADQSGIGSNHPGYLRTTLQRIFSMPPDGSRVLKKPCHDSRAGTVRSRCPEVAPGVFAPRTAAELMSFPRRRE